MQIPHRRQVVHHVNRPASLEQLVPPRLDRNVLKGDCAAQRLRILLCKEMHVLGLRTGQVIDLATGEVLPSPNGSLIRFDSLTESGVKVRKKPSRNTVGRTCTTGRPDQFSVCSASQCSLCCGLGVVSVMLI